MNKRKLKLEDFFFPGKEYTEMEKKIILAMYEQYLEEEANGGLTVEQQVNQFTRGRNIKGEL